VRGGGHQAQAVTFQALGGEQQVLLLQAGQARQFLAPQHATRGALQ
jgi:hypothetical protein